MSRTESVTIMPRSLDALTPEARELLARDTLAAVRRYLRSQREKEEKEEKEHVQTEKCDRAKG